MWTALSNHIFNYIIFCSFNNTATECLYSGKSIELAYPLRRGEGGGGVIVGFFRTAHLMQVGIWSVCVVRAQITKINLLQVKWNVLYAVKTL